MNKCKFCQKEFNPKDSIPSHRKRYRFCSRKCGNDNKKGKPMKGITPEMRRQLGLANKGKIRTEEAKLKNRIAHLGKKHNEEWKKKDSESQKKRVSEGRHNWYKDGRTKNKEYIIWLKGKNGRLKRAADGSHTFGEWETLKTQYNWTCPACKRKEPEIKLSLDHIVPLSKGGSNNIENIQPLCLSCNFRKHTKTIKYDI